TVSFTVLLFITCSRALPSLHSFPTRRSSDLIIVVTVLVQERNLGDLLKGWRRLRRPTLEAAGSAAELRPAKIEEATQQGGRIHRSEEHTSELQSRFDLVCRLLLEKKKKQKHIFQNPFITVENHRILEQIDYISFIFAHVIMTEVSLP